MRNLQSYFSTLWVIYTKELKGYLCVPFGWVILTCTMGIQGLMLQAVLETMTQATGNGVMYYMTDSLFFLLLFIFIFPLITMRTFAEEERLGTLEGLLTAPVTTSQILMGKYLAAYTFYIILWLPMLLYPWMSEIGNFYTLIRYAEQSETTITYMLADWVGVYSILALTGAFFIALGILCSSVTRSQIISAIFCTCLMIMYYFMGRVTDLWGEFPAAPIFHYISCSEQFRSFTSGVMDTRPVVLYLSMTVCILALTKRLVDYRRWTR
ncbi:MAG: ABC transporter permease [Akkermansia sp.]|nr:ABC transporter permease [Akkermansia sp.]